MAVDPAAVVVLLVLGVVVAVALALGLRAARRPTGPAGRDETLRAGAPSGADDPARTATGRASHRLGGFWGGGGSV